MAIFSFLTGSKEAQNEAHLRNLILMARSDNDIDKSEVDVIVNIGIDRGFTEGQIKKMLKNNDRSELFIPDNDHERFDQLYDLTQVMLADGIIEDDEMEYCTNFANKIGFRKTISWLLILLILEGVEKGVDKEWIYHRCKHYLSV